MISEGGSRGPCVLVFEPNYLEKKDADWMFDTMLAELPWRQQKGTTAAGEVFFEPRMTAWFSDYDYKYSRVTQVANKHVSFSGGFRRFLFVWE